MRVTQRRAFLLKKNIWLKPLKKLSFKRRFLCIFYVLSISSKIVDRIQVTVAKPHFDVAVRLSLKTEVKKLLSTPAFFSSIVTLLFNNVFYQRACVTFLLWLTY